MEIKDNQVIFELDEKKIEALKLSLNILNVDGDTVFNRWLVSLNREALKTTDGIKDYLGYGPLTRSDDNLRKLDNKVVQLRINRWAENKTGYAYKMLSVFFELYDKNDDHKVLRSEMDKLFQEKTDDGRGLTINRFIILFRQMCSDSYRAYGSIFEYDVSTDEVKLSQVNEEFILNLKDKFKD